MLKQILITSALLLGSTQLSASQCETYGSEVDMGGNSFFFVL